MSRPTKTADQKRTEKIGARLTPTEAKLVRQRAESKMQPLTDYVRERILSDPR